jgi:hypothetical protein
MFCPSCREIYHFRNPLFADVLGVFFGREYVGRLVARDGAPHEEYVPRIYGFRLLERPPSQDGDDDAFQM